MTAEDGTREPMIEIFDETEQLEVLTELPGVEEEKLHLEITETKITMSAADRGRRCHEEIFLRVTVEAKLEKTFADRVLRTKPRKKPSRLHTPSDTVGPLRG